MDIYLDFDATVVVGPFPDTSQIVPGAIDGIKKLQKSGFKIILNTLRADIGEKHLIKAITVLKDHGVDIDDYVIRKVPPHNFDLHGALKFKQLGFNTKIFIDDISRGIPLKGNGVVEYVDWDRVMKAFEDAGLL